MRPPALLIALIVINVIRAKRSARRHLRQDRFREAALAGIQFSRPRARAPAAAAHRGQQMWPGVERHCGKDVTAGQMMLESVALGGCQWGSRTAMKVANEVALAIACYAVAEDEVVHSPTDIDRINLNETEATERGRDTGDRRIQ